LISLLTPSDRLKLASSLPTDMVPGQTPVKPRVAVVVAGTDSTGPQQKALSFCRGVVAHTGARVGTRFITPHLKVLVFGERRGAAHTPLAGKISQH